uniref:Uncharacterized protein n=1 Tax=Arundo donax TaxID=35708 RepID=A0A0A9AY82_ARUDO
MVMMEGHIVTTSIRLLFCFVSTVIEFMFGI